MTVASCQYLYTYSSIVMPFLSRLAVAYSRDHYWSIALRFPVGVERAFGADGIVPDTTEYNRAVLARIYAQGKPRLLHSHGRSFSPRTPPYRLRFSQR